MRRPINLVFCIDSMRIGGTELNALRIAESLPKELFKLQVAALSTSGPMLERYQDLGVPVVFFPFRSFADPSAVRAGLRFRSWLIEQDIAIVHAHDIYSNIFAVPWAYAAGVCARISSRRWGSARSRRLRIANRLAYRFATTVVTNSTSGANLLRQEGIKDSRIHILPNFVEEAAFCSSCDHRRLEWLQQLQVPESARVIGIVANLNPWKSHHVLLNAFAKVRPHAPGWYLIAFGDGPCKGSLQSLARKLQIDNWVRFPGHVSNRPNPHCIFDISVLVSPDEGMPNSILEAMAAGRPVVATRVGGIPDLVHDGRSGILTPPADPDAIAAALLTLTNSPETRSRMGLNGRARARKEFSQDVVLRRLIDLYDELAEKCAPRRTEPR
jgi:glycosyltransferase involved in cell wall biosynthesis